ncbi:MAG: glycoside hydrolase family 57 protein [Planctomycetota bacterium]
MSGSLTLCLVWHQHQPWYIDPETEEITLPWVRLHGVKDYLPMALLLEEEPRVRATINLVPSLLDQIEAYAHGRTDPILSLSRKRPSDLSEADRIAIVDRFFMANAAHQILPYERYRELHAKRSHPPAGTQAHRAFTDADILDLQVWYNLCWVHPILFEREPEARRLLQKGRGFSESDKNVLLDLHLAWLKEIIPAHRRLAERGQVELTTSPYYHPILPLLFNMERAREALPGLPMPEGWRPRAQDADEQIRRAFERHERTFGTPPKGVWPSEGSVSPETAEALARAGVRWIATDEEILGRSLGTAFPRDGYGHVVEGSALYRPWSFETGAGPLSMLFRDRSLSDRIGFQYRTWNADDAAGDFVHRLRVIAERNGADDAVCPVVLDGENAWEWFPGSGIHFLRALYRALSADPIVRTSTVSGFLSARPPTRVLPRLFSGSWIYANFAIWVGHPEDREGWSRLYRTAAYFDRKMAELGPAGTDVVRKAWESLLRAEGSDWFWWFGDDHSSLDDDRFDELFRKHLAGVYRAFGDPPPAFLLEPVRRPRIPTASKPREPSGFLNITLDGALTHYFEWRAGARFHWREDIGAIERQTEPAILSTHWGFDAETLYLRADFSSSAPAAFAQEFAGVVRLLHPAEIEIAFPGEGARGDIELRRPGQAAVRCGGWARGAMLEAAVPFAALGVKPGDEILFHFEWPVSGGGTERLPMHSALSVKVPDPDFERIHWVV